MTVFPAFVATPQIRWSDLDLLGHVNNARIVTLIEQARIDWLNTMRDREAIAAPKLVARVELNYRTPVLYGPELQVQLGIGRVGGSSFIDHVPRHPGRHGRVRRAQCHGHPRP